MTGQKLLQVVVLLVCTAGGTSPWDVRDAMNQQVITERDSETSRFGTKEGKKRSLENFSPAHIQRRRTKALEDIRKVKRAINMLQHPKICSQQTWVKAPMGLWGVGGSFLTHIKAMSILWHQNRAAFVGYFEQERFSNAWNANCAKGGFYGWVTNDLFSFFHKITFMPLSLLSYCMYSLQLLVGADAEVPRRRSQFSC